MIGREVSKLLKEITASFKAIAITGPRQCGKTTLTKSFFPEKPYVTLENPTDRNLALADPVRFLSAFPQGAILDEVQKAPELFSYLQGILDQSEQKGKFILTGSNNFLLLESISQSLAGRVGYLDLLPFSIRESEACPQPPATLEESIFLGGYPSVVHDRARPETWFASYVRTYVERDVRLVKNISDLSTFQRFLYLCAGRIGQQINLTNLANEVGVDHKTIQSWLGVLQASYIIYTLPPYYKNFNKRLTKASKLYFYDTGLACYLLGIKAANELTNHGYRGHLFENFLVVELLKNRYNKGQRSNLFYWRDSSGNEVDVLIDNGSTQIPVEIKSAATLNLDFFKGLNYWEKLTGQIGGKLVYSGDEGKNYKEFTVHHWKSIGNL
ncbi:MAG: ATP-binding protein [Flammeovirgaceae bacterium]|jgi:predicted AAA+ superfamily ATPase|nr:ATP-binding protein [Flammeovirgaceae bacterium]